VAIPFQPQPHQFTITAAQLLSTAVVVVVTGMNYLGVRTAGRFQLVLTALKVLAVVAILVLGVLAGGHSAGQTAGIVTPAHSVWTGCLLALVPVMAAYNGFQFLGSVGGEVANPEVNLPRAAIVGTTLVVGLYVLANLVYFRVLTFSEVAQSQHVASDAVAKMVGAAGAKWFTVAMVLSAFGSLHATFLTGPRVPFAMARDGLFFGFAKRVHPVFHTPSGAVIFQGCVSVVLVLTGTYQELYSYTIFGTWIFLALTAFALIRLRMREPDLARPYRVWGYPWTPLIFATAAIAMTANLLWLRPARSLVGVTVILLGLPFFHYWRRQAAGIEGNE
jgi:APA family basic amino acid/polyamine antiporter